MGLCEGLIAKLFPLRVKNIFGRRAIKSRDAASSGGHFFQCHVNSNKSDRIRTCYTPFHLSACPGLWFEHDKILGGLASLPANTAPPEGSGLLRLKRPTRDSSQSVCQHSTPPRPSSYNPFTPGDARYRMIDTNFNM